MSWEAVRAAWDAGWVSLAASASATWEAAIRAEPAAYVGHVTRFAEALDASRRSLDALRAGLLSPPATPAEAEALSSYQAMEARYAALAAGLYADAVPAPGASVGVAPLVVAAGLAVGAAGVAWAVAAWEYAANLRDQTALAERELAARVAASAAGRALPPSTLPPPPPGPAPLSPRGAGAWLLGGLALAAAALSIPILVKR